MRQVAIAAGRLALTLAVTFLGLLLVTFLIGCSFTFETPLQEAGIEVEADEPELVIRRVIQANGRTRAFINGQMATASQLAQVTSGLADISSQHQYHTLVDAKTHLGYLDAFAGLEADREAMVEALNTLRRAAGARLPAGNRSAYVGTARIEDIDSARMIQLIGTNPRVEAPVHAELHHRDVGRGVHPVQHAPRAVIEAPVAAQ